eukprot:m.819433 g.819433  ORF g.819433 m.819433 type:complete len:617 (+) comp59392_c0_seq2:1050-2900(+)
MYSYSLSNFGTHLCSRHFLSLFHRPPRTTTATMSTADALKDLGNKAFSAKDFNAAIKHFTDAIALDGSNHVLYSNRSASHASLNNFDQALHDANKTIELKPDWAKGYGRKGAALFGQGDHEAARDAYKEGLKLDPTNAQLREGLNAADQALLDNNQDAMHSLAEKFTSQESLAALKAHPTTSGFFLDSAFAQKFELIRANPGLLQQLMTTDQRLMQCFGVILGINLGTGAAGPAPTAAASTTSAPAAQPASATPNAESAPAATTTTTTTTTASAEMDTSVEEPEDEDAKATAARKADAAKAKEQGSAAYKAKDFQTALKHFDAAHQLDPTDMVYRLNSSACYFELKDFDACIKAGLEASDIGSENRADFTLRAKAFTRVAKAYLEQDKLTEALVYLNKSLTEHRTPDIAKLKQETEKKLKEKERLTFINPQLSLEAKERGNELFKAQKYPDAIKEYNEAIARNPDDGKIYSNRAACYIKMAEFSMALTDCNTCIKLEPTFGKAYIRKGNVLLGMKKTTEALDAYQKALELESGNAEAQQGVENCYKAMYGGGQSREERAKAAMSDPEIQAILGDPVMRSILEQMSTDPTAAREHLQNPEIAKKINRLMQAGILEAR